MDTVAPYDRETDTLTITLREVRIRESDEVRPGGIADFGYDGELVRFEVLEASKHVRECHRDAVCRGVVRKDDEAARHDKLVMLVERMLALTPKLRAAKTDAEKATLQNAVSKTDQDTDALVYELYALTPAEAALVEGGSAPPSLPGACPSSDRSRRGGRESNFRAAT